MIATHVFEQAPKAGNELRILQLAKWLAAQYEVHVIVKHSAEIDSVQWAPNLYVHYLGNSTTGAFPDVPEILHPVERDICPDSLLERFRIIFNEILPEVVIAEYVFMSRIFHGLPASVFKLIDTHDVFSRRQAKVREMGVDDRLVMTEELESEFLDRADALLAITPVEAEVLARLAPERRVITTGVAFQAHAPRFPLRLRTPYAVIVASDNPSNRKGIRDFLDQCWPQIRDRVPEAELRIFGRVCEALGKAPSGVCFNGPVDRLADAYRDAAFVMNPVEPGTGLKIKTVEAISWSLPLVAFPNGVEGIPVGKKRPYLLASDWNDFARASIRLYKNSRLRKNLAMSAYGYSRSRLAHRPVYQELAACLKERFSHGQE